MTPDKTDNRCSTGVKNEQRIIALEQDMSEVKGAVQDIRDKLLGRLPNWATALITILTAIAVGLIVNSVR